MTPDDFKFDLMEHAYALRRQAMARSASHDLDPATCTWVITDRAWREFQKSADILTAVEVNLRDSSRRLLGLRVRITVDDEAGTTPVQLLMGPLLAARPGRVRG